MGSTQVRIDTSSEVPIITATGEIDIATAPLLLDRFNELPSGTAKVVVDLSEVTFLDSSGLGALIACEKRLSTAEQSGRVHLVISRPQIMKLLDITGLRETFMVAPTLEEAIAQP